MDSSRWIHGYAANSNAGGGISGFMGDYTASCIPAVFQCEEPEHELLVSSQIQQRLNQISMQLNIDDESAADYSQHCSFVGDDFDLFHDTSSSLCCNPEFSSTAAHVLANSYHATSSPFRSASLSCSPAISSTAAHVLATAATGPQFPEVSSLLAPGVVLPYVDQYAANFHDTPVTMASCRKETSVSAFRRYERHLGPKRRLTKPANGQKMFKTAMSVLANMHTVARYNHQQQQKLYIHQQQQQQLALEAQPSENQLQHMISERKRREKLNDSFHALKAVLPPGSKKDRTSTLITAREYVNSLKSKVCELEEKNRALLSQLARRRATSAEEDDAGEKVDMQITSRAAAVEDDQAGEVRMVKIVTRPARGNVNTTDVVLKTLQCLKDLMDEDVSLVSMSTGDDDDSDGPHRASLTLHLKSIGVGHEMGGERRQGSRDEGRDKSFRGPAYDRETARHPTSTHIRTCSSIYGSLTFG